MADNRLEIKITAEDSAFRSALSRLSSDSKKAGNDIAKSFEITSEGAGALEQAIEEAANAFGGVASTADKELSRVERAAVEAGSALDKSFDSLDVSKVTREVNFLEQALEKAGYQTGALEDVADSLDEIGDSAKDAGDKLGNAFQAQAVADFAGQVSDAGKQIGDFFEGAAADARNIDREIRKTFDDPKDVQNFSKIIGNIKAEFGDLADSQGLIEATKTLENFGIASEKELRQVINIANATGRSYQEIAERQGEFFASASGGQVNVQALNEYRKVIGAGAVDLKKYGVVLDENNNIVAKTPEQIQKAQDALRTYISENERFSGVLERAQDNQDKLDAQVGALNESLGVQVNEFKNVVAGGLLPFVKGLNNSSDSVKKFVGLSIAGGSAVLEYGGKLVQFAAFAKAAGLSTAGLTAGLTRATAAARAFAVGTGGMVAGLAVAAAGVALIAKSMYDYADAIDQAEQAEQKLAATQSKVAVAYKDRIAKVKESTDALREEYKAIEDFGKRRATIAKDILLRESAAADARADGNDKLAGQLEAEARILRSVRSEYDLTAKTVADAEKKKQAAIKKSQEAFEKEQKARDEAREEQKKKDEEAAQRRLQLDEQYAQAALQLERSSIQQRAALAQEAPELKSLERRLAKGEDVIDQIKREATEQANKLKSLIDEEAALERIAIKRQEAAAAKADPDGADQIAKQAAEQIRQVNVQAAAEKAKLDRENAAKLEELDTKRADLRKQKAKEAADEEAKAAEQAIKSLDVQRAKQEENFAARRRQLDEEERLGIDISQKRLDLEKEIQDFNRQVIDERLQAELEVIKTKRDAANVGASASQQELNNSQAELDIQQAILKSKQDTRAIDDQELTKAREKTAEIEKQIEAQKTLNDEKKKGFSIDSDFGDVSGLDNINSFGEGFGKKRGPKEEEGPTEQELQRQLARAKVEEIQAAERVKRGQSSPASDRTKAINEAERAKTATDSATSPQAPPKVELPPEVVGLFQQMVNALNQTAQNTARANQQQSQQQSFRNSDVAQNFTRGTGSTLYD